MMIHEKLMSGQFLFDLKNERNGGIAQQQQALHQLQLPSPPLGPLDIYSAYAYQQQIQQQLLTSHLSTTIPVKQASNSGEVLDLSRRDVPDSQRRTPSPHHTNSSLGAGSPATSPNNSIVKQPLQPQLLPANSFYNTQLHQQAAKSNNLHVPANFANIYTGLYCPAVVKEEHLPTTPPPSVTVPISQPAPTIGNNNIVTKIFKPLRNDLPEPQSPQRVAHTTVATTPTSSVNNLALLDSKSTRPFKAFPRDPLIIAANFAATDVLLDDPRAERYSDYRKRVLEHIQSSNGGSRTVTNPKMRRTNSASGSVHEGSSNNTSENDDRHHDESSDCDSSSLHDHQTAENTKSNENMNSNSSNNTSSSGGIVKDAAYYERRRKNNAAAKKSRDRRRIKEDEIAIRASYLERQNIELLCQIDALKAQVAALTSQIVK